VIQTILELGNQVLANLGVEEPITDVTVFFSDQFYIRFFEGAFPHVDFSGLEEAQTDEEMADNIQALIDLLSEDILRYDLSHIKGEEIVDGNAEHCINFLQLAKEISLSFRNYEFAEEGSEQQQHASERGSGGHHRAHSDQEMRMRQQMEQAMEDVQMEDVSINLEDGMNSADDLNLPADHPMKHQNQHYGQEDDSFDKRDPLEMAQEALMGQGADEADQEIEQIINKKQGWHNQSDEDELDEEQYAQYQQQLAGS
jgi:hypothetical protein